MSRLHSYLNSAEKILDTYNGEVPFAIYLKQFFREQKKYGSKDRKVIAGLCFNYFRLGSSLSNLTKKEKLLAAEFLLTHQSIFSELFPAEWIRAYSLSTIEKLEYFNISLSEVFDLHIHISSHLNRDAFIHSHFLQPDTFLRLRPGKQKIVLQKLQNANIPFTQEENDCLRLAPNQKLDEILSLDAEAVVQDLNSQKVLFGIDEVENTSTSKVWDVCAASGGKSILVWDKLKGNARLTLTDIRQTILTNLKFRLGRAKVPIYHLQQADLTTPLESINGSPFNIIICDVPCSGSGTWSRTPEQLTFFNAKKVEEYAEKQRKIVSNSLSHLKTGGVLYYITCSVFADENENNVKRFISDNLELVHQQYFKGYNMLADTLFVAVFKKV